MATVFCLGSGVYALGQHYFDDTSSECDFLGPNGGENANLCNNANKSVRLSIGQTTNVPLTKDVLRAYYRLPYNAATGKLTAFPKDANGHSTVILTVVHADFCPSYPSGANGNVPPQVGDGAAVDVINNGYYAQKYINSGYTLPAQTTVTEYSVGTGTGGSYAVEKDGVFRADGNCGASRNITFWLTTGEFTAVQGQPGVFYVQFRAAYHSPRGTASGANSPCVKNPTNSNCDGIMNSFSLSEAGSDFAYRIANASPSDPDSPNGYGATIREQDDSNPDPPPSTKGDEGFRIPFGADCTVKSANTATVIPLWDLDGANVQLALKRAPDSNPNSKTTAKDWSWWTGANYVQPHTGGWSAPHASNWSADESTYAAAPPPSAVVNAPSTNDATLYWNFTADPGYYYVLYMLNVNPILIQQYSTPFDGIYFEQPCPTTSPELDCQIVSGPSLIDPSQSESVTLQVPDADNYSSKPSITANVNVVNSDSGTTVYNVKPVPSVSGPDPPASGDYHVSDTQINIPKSDYSTPGSYEIDATVTDGTIVATCSSTFDVGLMPYLSVWGGDAVAGVYPDDTTGSQQCSTYSTAGFDSWNNDGNPDYAGAGGQEAVMAYGDESYHFVSALGGNIPSLLTFANDSGPTPPDYGGNFGGYDEVPSNCDFVGAGSVTNSGGDITAMKSAAGYSNGSFGGKTTYVITNSDVYISNNIVYASNGSWTLGTIPSFKLVVNGGDIYINGGVTELDGVYVAEPNSSGNGGTIYSCATGKGSAVALSSLTFGTSSYNTCNHQLQVFGSFVAKQVVFNRVSGSLGQAKSGDTYKSSPAAEKFIYSPEIWLPNGSGGGSFDVDSYQGLPPVL